MVDWDAFLAYETLKIVRIRDKRLGTLYYSLIGLVMCYVIGFQILYKNEHFQRFDVQGMGRVTIQQPTLNMCNPNDHDCLSDYKPLTDLPYCDVYTGDKPATHQHTCTYADQHSLSPRGMLSENMLIPTRIDKHVETKACEPSKENGWTCTNEYTAAHANADSTENVYVADIERFTVLLSHTFHRGVVRGNSLQTPGSYRVCPEPKESAVPGGAKLDNVMSDTTTMINGQSECATGWESKSIDCVNDKCLFVSGYQEPKDCGDETAGFLQAWRGGHKSPVRSLSNESSPNTRWAALNSLVLAQEEPEPEKRPGSSAAAEKGILAIPPGDVFPVKDLLQIAGVTLDGGKGVGKYNADCEPYREAGVLVEVEAFYTNMEPWISSFRHNNDHIHYTYNIRTRPVGEIKTEQFASMQPLDFPSTRLIENRHGIYLVLKVTGEFGEFSIVYLLVMLTTSLALLAVVTKLVDFLAIYVLADKERYHNYKYQVTDEVRDTGGPIIAGAP